MKILKWLIPLLLFITIGLLVLHWHNEIVNEKLIIERSKQEGKINTLQEIIVKKEEESILLKKMVDQALSQIKKDTVKIYKDHENKISTVNNLTTTQSMDFFAKQISTIEINR